MTIDDNEAHWARSILDEIFGEGALVIASVLSGCAVTPGRDGEEGFAYQRVSRLNNLDAHGLKDSPVRQCVAQARDPRLMEECQD